MELFFQMFSIFSLLYFIKEKNISSVIQNFHASIPVYRESGVFRSFKFLLSRIVVTKFGKATCSKIWYGHVQKNFV